MLREIELGSALLKDLGLTAAHVAIDVPLHKTAPGGECVMTRRRLERACVQVRFAPSRRPSATFFGCASGVRRAGRPSAAGAGRRVGADAGHAPADAQGAQGVAQRGRPREGRVGDPMRPMVLWGQKLLSAGRHASRLPGRMPVSAACRRRQSRQKTACRRRRRRETRPGGVVLVVDRGRVIGRVRFGRLSDGRS